jgi:hypothetical protein
VFAPEANALDEGVREEDKLNIAPVARQALKNRDVIFSCPNWSYFLLMDLLPHNLII